MSNSALFSFVRACTFACLGLLVVACDDGEPEPGELRSGSIDPTPRPATKIEPAQAPPTGSLRDQLMALSPQMTRAGWVRFTDPMIHEPGATAILLERLTSGSDAPDVRAAVAEAIGRTGGEYAVEVSQLLASEADPRVREMLVGTLGRQVKTSDALVGLGTALQDSSPVVRAAAARTLAERSDGAQLGDALIGLLADAEPSVRGDAARSLGILQVAAATEPLSGLLADGDADVRLDALRAIHRLDPTFARSLPVLAQLERDDDQRVQRLATKIRG